MEQRTVWIISTEAEAIRAALESMIDIDVADPYTTHEYSVVTRWSTWWRWWLDGELRYENNQPFSAGDVGGQSMVHNECDSAYTRWLRVGVITMQRRMFGRTLAAVFVLSLTLTGVIVGCQQSAAVPSKAEIGEMRHAKFKVKRELDLDWVSLEEAARRMPFRILQPSYLPAGVTLSGVRVTKADETIQAVHLIYSNGVTVIQTSHAVPGAAELEEVARTTPHELLEVNGVTAIGHETLTSQGGISGRADPVLADVAWGCDGRACRVTGDMPLEELLRVAESMR